MAGLVGVDIVITSINAKWPHHQTELFKNMLAQSYTGDLRMTMLADTEC